MTYKISKQWLYRLIFLLIVIIAIIAYRFLFYYLTYSRDAYVYANVVNISSVVSGNITEVLIKDNQQVNADQALVQLDPAPFRYAVEQAKAQLQTAKVNYENAKNTIKQYADIVTEKETALNTARDHLKRYQALYKQKLIPQITIINTEAQVQAASAAVASAKQELMITQQEFNENAIIAAKAKLKAAQYDLDHATIRAPTKGYITNVYLRKGNYIHAGDDLFALVESDRWWVIARYRETVIRRIHPGNKVHVHIDMYPNQNFQGIVQSIGWGINRRQSSNEAAQSSLEYLKPTEDWIQIAQRFPVRILLTDLNSKHPLRIGATAYTYIHVNPSQR